MKRFERKLLHSILLPTTVAFCFAVIAAAYQSLSETERIIIEAARRTEEYGAKFKDLTAEETKVTEIFDDSGKIEQSRTVLSDFVVYESRLDNSKAFEYHNVREVDGKAVTKREKRVVELFERLAKISSIEKELERIERESYRYDLKFRAMGLTLNQGPSLREKYRSHYSFESGGREQIDGNEVIIVRYRQASYVSGIGDNVKLPSEFKDPQPRWRGTLWLDARTFHIWRDERELTVRHPRAESPLTVIRSEQVYGPSEFGILTPKKFVFSFFTRFRNKGKPELLLNGRLTYTYSQFKRFQVTSEEKIDKPASDKPPP